MELAMIDRNITPLTEARVSVNDRALYFGDGVYEVVRSYNGGLFAMDRHILRLERSLREIDMLAKVNLGDIEQRVRELLSASKMADAVIYFHITRGANEPRAHNYPDTWEPCFLATVRPGPAKSRPTASCITAPDLRWKRCDIKSLNLLPNIMAKHKAVAAGCYEAIFINDAGLVTEGTACSVFIVRDGILQTAPLTANILPGITRALIIEWAGQAGVDIREESFTPDQMLAADEVMITGTGSEVIGVTDINGRTIADGRCGHITQKYQKLLADMTHAGCS